ncbi:hypothetical protein CLV62_106114 [Dysgonomonas alginatilytica]|uniref:Uncharacterized protein n=1 Tax=Dysgonomonas alginatilytica TaxID=1605892 RepID=A0A2V3PTE3_9BACT|nr:hypothetical protein [Dysgonomonas alginatilytica]PXV65940.1 hypothetical protein CLV62_106114 [Dysgonomonas alginatilytica]
MNKFLLVFISCVLTCFSGFAADYYWVGGGGNWSDINHWRTTSGGTGIPGVVPGPTDDVFFDVNSGFTVSSKTLTVNVVANCRNITFSGLTILPTVSSNSANHLNRYGSSLWQAGMTINTAQINYQNTGIPKTITSNGVASGRIVYIYETSSVSLMDNFKIASHIFFNAGVFNTNNHNMDIGNYFYGDQGSAPRTLNLLGGRNDVNFVNIKDINATGGLTLHFGDKSTVAGQNNTNVTYDAYNSGEFNGFPSDWTCHFIDTDISTSYTLTADGFFGNEYTEYIWTKVGDVNFPDVIGTEHSIDLRIFGYGTYRVQVKYNATCIVSGLVTIIKRTDNVDGGVQPSKVCLLPINTLANVSVVGEDLKCYATAVSADVLPLTTVLSDGTTYYVTQTINNCESGRVPITIRIGDCTSVYVNPNLRMRVPM